MEHKPNFSSRWEYLPVPVSLKGQLFDNNDNALDRIEGLSKINIFVGENNSGKSRLLRELLKQIYTKTDISNELNQKYQQLINNTKDELLSYWDSIDNEFKITEKIRSSPGYTDDNENKIKEMIENLCDVEKFNTDIDIFYYNLLNWLNDVWPNNPDIKNEDVLAILLKIAMVRKHEEIKNHIVQILDDIKIKLEKDFYFFKTPIKLEKIFIPTHRSSSNTLLDSIKLNTYINKNYKIKETDYSLSKTEQSTKKNDTDIHETIIMKNYINIQSGLDFFEELKEKLLTDSDTREDLYKFEQYLGANFFNKQQFSITPGEYKPKEEQQDNQKTEGDQEIKIKKGKDKNLKVYDLGTGLQMIMILTWPIFNYESGMLFIEEPELFLHPKLQNQLIDFYASKEADEFQFFIATHSNHIIDAFNNQDSISIFTLQKVENIEFGKSKFILNKIEFGNLTPYELLGVKASSLALANCIIWVEGPSDRIYIKKWIELLSNYTLIEGMHYQIVFYGGNIKSHFTWREDDNLCKDLIKVIRINHKSIFVTDSDRNNESEPLKSTVERIKHEFENVDGLCWITEGREIENYLSKEIIKETFAINNIEEIGKYEKFDQYFEKLKVKKIAAKYGNKVEFAKMVINKMNNENIDKYDLRERVNEIITKIKQWNGL